MNSSLFYDKVFENGHCIDQINCQSINVIPQKNIYNALYIITEYECLTQV